MERATRPGQGRGGGLGTTAARAAAKPLILLGTQSPTPPAIDLGLVVRRDEVLQVANPIYREVLPRVLTSTVDLKVAVHFRAA